MVKINAREREHSPQLLDEVGYFDTQFHDRELQCYVASDGRSEVRTPAGEVFARHDFADRSVCEGETIVLGSDGSLTWQ
ncbi:hypothetical protein [Demequina sp. NBRC 110051]|uniref:hypothetical protein n=1 Tax=Demequina sp. NBRC 110051 TaxID=1570340 RepID=UPI00117FCFEA|nr:hypothetical protein [Demequina sp. NBRC 110051]